MKNQTSHKVLLFYSLMALFVLFAQTPSQSAESRRGGLYGDWMVKVDYDGRQMESILSFSRNNEGEQIGQWISFWGLSDLKDIKFEEGKLSFTRENRNRDGQTITSKFTGTIQDGKLSGTLSSDRGELTLEGERSERMPRAVGNWEIKYTIGEREITSMLVIETDKNGELKVQWQSQRVKHVITDVQSERGSLTFKIKSSMEDREWESTFEGTISRNALSGILKSERGEIPVEGERIGASLIGNWDLEITSDQGSRKQRLRVNPDLSGLYGSTPIKKVNLEDGKVSFKITLEFGDREFEMSFEGKLEESDLTGEITSTRGSQKVTGKKVVRTRRNRNN